MQDIFKNKSIIIGITGSISAYKAPLLVRELVKYGAEVNVVATPSALNFVTPLTLENLSRKPVHSDIFDKSMQTSGAWHIHLVHNCDAMIIAPCSATTLGKIANGICDNALVALAIALPKEKPLLIAPAMDSSMWLHPATQRNVELLKSFGTIIIPPEDGDLSSGLIGPGRLPDTEILLEYLARAIDENYIIKPRQFAGQSQFKHTPAYQSNKTYEEALRSALDKPSFSLQDAFEKDKFTAELELELLKKAHAEPSQYQNSFAGKKILITAGPTYEKIDDVRYITNYSSGKMGFALAKEAANVGAEVVLISGPVSLPTPQNVRRIDVMSADEMFDVAYQEFADCDIAILAAAVSDYTPINPVHGKLKKSDIGDKFVLELQTTNDILATLGSEKAEHQRLIGFALESVNEIENGRKKLHSKNCDMIIVNSLNKPRSGFMNDDNTITIITKDDTEESFPPMSKEACSRIILKKISEIG